MKELIKLAKEKGFESRFYHYKTILQPTLLDLDMHQYFWMCELQKWLRDEKNIFVFVDPEFNLGDEVVETDALQWYIISNDTEMFDKEYYPTYEEALKAGLIEALKLI